MQQKIFGKWIKGKLEKAKSLKKGEIVTDKTLNKYGNKYLVLTRIDKKNYMQMKTQFFDEFGDLINVMNSVEIADFGGKKLPSKIEFIPLEKEGNKTVIERLVWEFDIDINPRFFTPGYMKNLR